jgi:hypothetical protein
MLPHSGGHEVIWARHGGQRVAIYVDKKPLRFVGRGGIYTDTEIAQMIQALLEPLSQSQVIQTH